MPAYFDGTEVDKITMDGTALDNLIIDGTEVWKGMRKEIYGMAFKEFILFNPDGTYDRRAFDSSNNLGNFSNTHPVVIDDYVYYAGIGTDDPTYKSPIETPDTVTTTIGWNIIGNTMVYNSYDGYMYGVDNVNRNRFKKMSLSTYNELDAYVDTYQISGHGNRSPGPILDKNGQYMYIYVRDSYRIKKIRLSDMTEVASLYTYYNSSFHVQFMMMGSDGYLYYYGGNSLDTGQDTVIKLSTSSLSPLDSINIDIANGTNPANSCYSGDNHLYVGYSAFGWVSRFNLSTHAITTYRYVNTTQYTYGAIGIAFDGTYIYVITPYNGSWRINAATGYSSSFSLSPSFSSITFTPSPYDIINGNVY